MHSEPVSRKSCHEASLNVPDALSKKKKKYKNTLFVWQIINNQFRVLKKKKKNTVLF